MKKLCVVLALSLFGMAATAQEVIRMDSLQASALGANYQTIFTYADFSSFTTTNSAAVITSTVPAKIGLSLVAMVLETAFDGSGVSTSYTQSVTVKVGDGSDDDYFLTSTELASDGTEVFVKYGAPTAYAVTATTTSLVYTAGDASIKTQAIVTAVSGAATASALNQKYFSAAGTVVYTFTPSAEISLSQMTSGRVKFYWRELK